jgi:hypothetical protein
VAHHILTRTSWLLIVVVLVLALVPSMAAAATQNNTLAATNLPSLSGKLAPGDNAVFTFSYPGNNDPVGIFLTYSPATTPTDPSVQSGPVLEVFTPKAPPPAKPIGRVTQDVSGHPGTRLATLTSRTEGTYTVVVTNDNELQNTINFTLTTALKTSTGAFDVAGPTLAQVSGPALPPQTTTPEVLAAPLPPAGTSVSGVLGAGQHEVLTFPYAGDNREVRLNLSYGPVPLDTDPSTADGLIIETFHPDASATADPIGRITSDVRGGQPGNRLLTLRSFTPGTYKIVLTNADTEGRQITFTLSTTVDNGSGDYIIPGPDLTVVFTGNP